MSGLLPTGTVTMLLADVEGYTRLWEANQTRWRPLVALLDCTLPEAVAAHGGVRAGDAVACALQPQRALLAPIRLRIGVRTGDIQRRDEGNYAGPTINRTARPRDLADGGQTAVGRDKRSGYRSTAGRCLVDRSGHTSSAPSAA